MASAEVNPSNPPVLIFRSKSGRTEIARQPDGTLDVHVLAGKDAWGASEIRELRRALPPVFEPGTTDAVTPNRRGIAEVDRAVYRLLRETGHEVPGDDANDGALSDAVDRALGAYRELRAELIRAAAERDAAYAAGYAEAVARLRDDDRYLTWWTSDGVTPDGPVRQHLADYLETVGPDGIDVTTGRWSAREQAAAVVAAERQRIADWLLAMVADPNTIRAWKSRHDLDSQYVGMALRALAADLTSGEPIAGLDDGPAGVSR